MSIGGMFAYAFEIEVWYEVELLTATSICCALIYVMGCMLVLR
jgi:hypothetical protein